MLTNAKVRTGFWNLRKPVIGAKSYKKTYTNPTPIRSNANRCKHRINFCCKEQRNTAGEHIPAINKILGFIDDGHMPLSLK